MADNKKTSVVAATKASTILRSKTALKAAKSVAGSALSQKKSTNVTSKNVVTKASTILRSKTASKAVKSAAGSALSQKHKG